MIEKRKKDWFKIKRYPHIGLPLNYRDRYKWIEKYITNPAKIAKHSFLPFIHKTAKVKKFRKVYSPINGRVDEKYLKGKTKLRKPISKERELFYASHLDSLVFSYYAHILSEKYDEILKIDSYNLNDVVNAYRSIPINEKDKDSANKCNIDFANDVFKFIRSYKQDEFAVIAFDVSNFFDTLDHKLLRSVWCKILGVKKLPADHFNVFKNITRFSYVDIVDLFDQFKDKIYTRKINKFGVELEIKRKKVSSIKFLRNQNAIAFCSEKEFFKLKGKLLQESVS